MSENLTDKVIGFMAVGGHKVDAETKLLLEQLDAGILTHEEAIKCIEGLCCTNLSVKGFSAI